MVDNSKSTLLASFTLESEGSSSGGFRGFLTFTHNAKAITWDHIQISEKSRVSENYVSYLIKPCLPRFSFLFGFSNEHLITLHSSN